MAPDREWQPSFEGLDLDPPSIGLGGSSSAIEKSAVTTIKALDSAGLLTDRHAVTCQLIIELSRAVGRGLAYGKVSVATATLAKQLLDAIDSLPVPGAGDSDAAAFAELARQLEQL
jgi:hypothetical protein